MPAVYTGETASSPPAIQRPPDFWRNQTSTSPPPPKQYSSETWWERMGAGGWVGLTCGLVILGEVASPCRLAVCHINSSLEYEKYEDTNLVQES